MPTDVILNKAQIIERCLRRVTEEYADSPVNLQNITKQDSIILNLQRACEAAMDMAMHMVAERRLGLPQSSREAFVLLSQNGIIEPKLSLRLQAMVGFRNIAVHDYQSMNLAILQGIIENNLADLKKMAEVMLKL
jgi:uncharacterized protein YutE (UPF0331/DUF86 family)